MLTRRHLRLVIALLLPLMVLRALLPPGYMPVADHGALRIVMCSAAGLTLPADRDGGHDPQPQMPSSGAGDCPFAHAAVAAPPVQYVVTVAGPPQDLRIAAAAANTYLPATGPPRTLSARAPPALS